jgi:undecaprenyl diphosphate synthase
MEGHSAGADSVRAVARMCGRLGVRELTLFAFSNENWRRPRSEVAFLMNLLRKFLISERQTIMENDVRLRAIGRTAQLPRDVQDELGRAVDMSAVNKGMVLRVALNYGGRQEIIDAARSAAEAVRDGRLTPAALDDRTLRAYLYDPQMTDPDLLIRTGGEMRLSNFLLWQVSYTELYFTPVCWPDFREAQLAEAFRAFASRDRRFGGVGTAPKPGRSRARVAVS